MAGKKRSASPGKKSRAKKRSKRSRGGFGLLLRTWLGVMAVTAAFIGAYILWSQNRTLDSKVSNSTHKESSAPAEPSPPSAEPATRRSEVTLFFGDADAQYLVPEIRTVRSSAAEIELARSVLQALIDGPSGSLQSTIPQGTRLLKIRINQRGICTVDFNSAFLENHPGGSSGELLTVYSIVESLTSNVPRIDAVQILVDGKLRETLAGHLFIGEPLRPNSRYVKETSS